MYQWVKWITRPDPEEEVSNIDWIISVFPGTNKDDGNRDPAIKSWGTTNEVPRGNSGKEIKHITGIGILYLLLARQAERILWKRNR